MFSKHTNLIKLQNFILVSKTIKKLFYSCAEGTGSLGEDHHLVVLDVLLHLLHGGAGDGSHPNK